MVFELDLIPLDRRIMRGVACGLGFHGVYVNSFIMDERILVRTSLFIRLRVVSCQVDSTVQIWGL
jgi:hypothetical protein